jgi:hypothetical protein
MEESTLDSLWKPCNICGNDQRIPRRLKEATIFCPQCMDNVRRDIAKGCDKKKPQGFSFNYDKPSTFSNGDCP